MEAVMRTLLLSLSLIAVGCATDNDSENDSDGDGLTNDQELELGTDPNVADTDGDGVSDWDEVLAGTDPLVNLETTDTDGDGLMDADELELGTDPTLADTDSDSFNDFDEVEAGSDPLDPFSWDYDGGVYPDYSENLPTIGTTGWAIGDVIPDAEVLDQHGNTLSLHQFYGSGVMLVFNAGWCGPCRTNAPDAQERWQTFQDQGLITMHLQIYGNTGDSPPTAADLTDWATEYGITFPVVADATTDIYTGLSSTGVLQGGIPTFVFINRDLTIKESRTGLADSSVIEGLLTDLLTE
jgi:peroxiredoxin